MFVMLRLQLIQEMIIIILNNYTNSAKIHDLDPYHTHVNSTNPLKSYYHYTPKSTLYPPAIINYNNKVTQTLTKIKRRHDATVTTLARGVQNWKLNYRDQLHSHSTSSLSSFPLNQFLDRFYMSRIGIRMLIGQTIALNVQHKGNITNPDYVGVIALRANVMEIAQDAISAARFACEEHYGIMDAPEVELYCPKDLQFMYVPGHLVHMLFETLKNSLRATVEFHSRHLKEGQSLEDVEFPSVKVIVAEGEEDITVKVSDEGGGIPRSAVPLVWTYFYTTADETRSAAANAGVGSGVSGGFGGLHDANGGNFKPPFMGLGVGLPHSRLYARYFGGDLKLISMEGYGTDVYLHLNRLSGSSEPLQ
ncbi:unnamed protein product [Ambrosiozyma monospora]|uniref:Protein-serine/threonine kinase n=1 Tax=Ambrosiozyma monospora TaxID=43982 RepID=A0A9W7DHI0_AMBMO|nr:unnamed protein product [Ambrosiozyma monospora]